MRSRAADRLAPMSKTQFVDTVRSLTAQEKVAVLNTKTTALANLEKITWSTEPITCQIANAHRTSTVRPLLVREGDGVRVAVGSLIVDLALASDKSDIEGAEHLMFVMGQHQIRSLIEPRRMFRTDLDTLKDCVAKVRSGEVEQVYGCVWRPVSGEPFDPSESELQ
jgi:hypothetical protein